MPFVQTHSIKDTSTSTVCTLKGPTASSTLIWASVKPTIATGTALLYVGGNTSTSTEIFAGTIAAGDTAAIVATTTPGASATLFDDGESLVIMFSGAGASQKVGVGMAGECKAMWRVLDN